MQDAPSGSAGAGELGLCRDGGALAAGRPLARGKPTSLARGTSKVLIHPRRYGLLSGHICQLSDSSFPLSWRLEKKAVSIPFSQKNGAIFQQKRSGSLSACGLPRGQRR